MMTGQFSAPYSKVWTARICGVLSSSIQFPRDIINILNPHFSGLCCKLQHLVFFSSPVRGNRKNMVCNLQ